MNKKESHTRNRRYKEEIHENVRAEKHQNQNLKISGDGFNGQMEGTEKKNQ